MLFACEKPVDLGPEKISIESSTVPAEIPVEGGEEYTLELTATVDWELRGYDEDVQKWLSINPSSGKASASPQTIKIKAMSNAGGATRKADLEIYGNPMARASLTITQLGDLVEDGTVEHPYSVASILALAEDSGWTNDNPSEELHVKGIVSRVKEYQLDTYGNISYYISDDGSESEELYVFGGYNFDCKRFTSEDELVNLALQCAAKNYEAITSARHITDRLTAALLHAGPLSAFDRTLFERTVSEIHLTRKGEILLKLQNGVFIEEGGVP